MIKPGDLYATQAQARSRRGSSSPIPTNHGQPITPEYIKTVEALFLQGASLEDTASALGRTPSSVCMRLCEMRYLAIDGNYNYCFTGKKFNTKQPQPPREITMAANIETKVLIAGQDASTMTDKEIFSFIAKLEKEQAILEGVKNKPKKLNVALNALQEDILKLIAYVDDRP